MDVGCSGSGACCGFSRSFPAAPGARFANRSGGIVLPSSSGSVVFESPVQEFPAPAEVSASRCVHGNRINRHLVFNPKELFCLNKCLLLTGSSFSANHNIHRPAAEAQER